MPIPELGQPPRYTGAVDCVVKTVKLEGLRGLYKGKFHIDCQYWLGYEQLKNIKDQEGGTL